MKGKRIEKFTESQEVALDRIKKFLSEKINHKKLSTRVLVLIGPAGSGKTTLARYALEHLIKSDLALDKNVSTTDLFQNPNVVGIAVAHQAKKNLMKSIHICRTFASYFGMKEVIGEEGERHFEPDPGLMRYALCKSPLQVAVHDEVSMYDKDMVKLLLEHTHPVTKIILMGDDAQLPPINAEGDEDSPVFTMFENIVELTEVVRQGAGNPILELATLIRQEIKGDQDIQKVIKMMKKDNVKNGIGYQTIPYKEFRKHFKNCTDDYREAKVLAYRRTTVSNYNLDIRKFIYKGTEEPFIPGEIIYMNDTYYHASDAVKIETVQQMEYEQGKTSGRYYCHNSSEYRIKNVELGSAINGVKIYKVFLEVEDPDDFDGAEDPFLPIVCSEGIPKYREEYFRRKGLAMQKGIDQKTRNSRWRFFYQFKGQFADASYSYALTSHKAQGSGYKYIYVDVNDIFTVGPISVKRKLQALYTDITRATDLVTFLRKNKS